MKIEEASPQPAPFGESNVGEEKTKSMECIYYMECIICFSTPIAFFNPISVILIIHPTFCTHHHHPFSSCLVFLIKKDKKSAIFLFLCWNLETLYFLGNPFLTIRTNKHTSLSLDPHGLVFLFGF